MAKEILLQTVHSSLADASVHGEAAPYLLSRRASVDKKKTSKVNFYAVSPFFLHKYKTLMIIPDMKRNNVRTILRNMLIYTTKCGE